MTFSIWKDFWVFLASFTSWYYQSNSRFSKSQFLACWTMCCCSFQTVLIRKRIFCLLFTLNGDIWLTVAMMCWKKNMLSLECKRFLFWSQHWKLADIRGFFFFFFVLAFSFFIGFCSTASPQQHFFVKSSENIIITTVCFQHGSLGNPDKLKTSQAKPNKREICVHENYRGDFTVVFCTCTLLILIKHQLALKRSRYWRHKYIQR